MADSIIGPTSHYFYSQRLKLHYVDWGNPGKPLMLMIHGGRDHCRNWDWAALELREHFHIIAPDLRGHGDSDWAIGGMYSMIDYVLDVAQLMKAVANEPVTLIGHSLGGGIVLQYAGTFPRTVKRVVSIEGLGPADRMMRSLGGDLPAYERMTNWIAQMQDMARRKAREYASIDEALARMRDANPHLSREQARHLTIWGVRRNENGTYSWKFDNYVHATSPYSFNMKDARDIWGRIECPTFLIRGSESWAGDWVKDGRFAAFKNAQTVTIEKAGHWVHHDQLGEFMTVVRRFLGV
ncbi:MAG TPA: alpha/beta hydrolase [Candidatus Binataceae bacterium]|nr:alpha/beta hydrolase [Candidatus Binataceae bacterium]